MGGRGSNGTALRFTVMPASCRRSSACLPSSCDARRSTSTRWTSVPPVSTLTPAAAASAREQPLGEDLRAADGALLPLLELRRRRDLEGGGLRRDDVHEGPALLPREHGRLELLRVLVVGGEDHAAARAGQRLVRGGGGDVGVRHRVGVRTGGDEPAEVRHVDHEQGADLVGDAAERREVELTRVRRPAGDDELRPGLERGRTDGVHVDPERLRIHPVRRDGVELAAEVDPHAMGQVAAVRELEAEDAVAGLDQRHHGRRVGLGPAVRLHVGVGGAEQCLDPVAGEVLGDVDELAAAVVATAGVALGVLVRQHAALGLEDRARGEVLAGDHFEGAALAAQLAAEHRGELGVDLRQRRGRHSLGRGAPGRGAGGLVEHGHSCGRRGGRRVRARWRASGPRRTTRGRRLHRSPVVTHLNASRGDAQPSAALARAQGLRATAQ